MSLKNLRRFLLLHIPLHYCSVFRYITSVQVITLVHYQCALLLYTTSVQVIILIHKLQKCRIARTVLYNWLAAKRGQLDLPKSTGWFILRVEDTDVACSTKESEASVLADLGWLGIAWDEGPDAAGAEFVPYR